MGRQGVAFLGLEFMLPCILAMPASSKACAALTCMLIIRAPCSCSFVLATSSPHLQLPPVPALCGSYLASLQVGLPVRARFDVCRCMRPKGTLAGRQAGTGPDRSAQVDGGPWGASGWQGFHVYPLIGPPTKQQVPAADCTLTRGSQ